MDKLLLKIINEEINDFDFLSNEQHEKDQENNRILRDEKFQKQFIIDSITRMRDKIKIDASDSEVYNDPEVTLDNYHNDMNIESNIEVTYQYSPEKQPLRFDLSFVGKGIGYATDYDKDIETGYGESWYRSIDWENINTHLYTDDGEEIKFMALEKAPEKIYELFVRSYIESVIEENTDIGDVREKRPEISSF